MVDVPTKEEFNALAARVTTLEEGTTVPPIDPPPVTGNGNGIQAKRIASMVELLNYCTFSSMDSGNVWGSWPADYRPASVIAAFDYMYKGSGFCPGIREYHYKGRESWQIPWIKEIVAKYPDSWARLCVGVNGSTNDAQSITALTTGVDKKLWRYGESINEPNMNFGYGTLPSATTVAITEAMKNAQNMIGPSVVFGLPNAHEYIKAYFQPASDLDKVCAAIKFANGHYYPPHNPDTIGDGTSLTDVVGSLWNVYKQHLVMITEYHSTLYNMTGAGHAQTAGAQQQFATEDHPASKGKEAINQRMWQLREKELKGSTRSGAPEIKAADYENQIPAAGNLDHLDGYYLLLALFRSAQCGVTGLDWYALFDYADVYKCGMFPVNGYEHPRTPAKTMKRLCSVVKDTGDKYGFTPGKLDCVVSGLGANCTADLYQASDKRFLMLLWKSGENPGGTAVNVKFDFGYNVTVEDYDLLAETAPRTGSGRSYTSQLPNGCRVLSIRPS